MSSSTALPSLTRLPREFAIMEATSLTRGEATESTLAIEFVAESRPPIPGRPNSAVSRIQTSVVKRVSIRGEEHLWG